MFRIEKSNLNVVFEASLFCPMFKIHAIILLYNIKIRAIFELYKCTILNIRIMTVYQ
jgi:hypothetical protein